MNTLGVANSSRSSIPSSLMEVVETVKSPIFRLSLSGELLEHNAGAALIIDNWNIRPGDPIPEPWLSTALETAATDESGECTWCWGLVSKSLVFLPSQALGEIVVIGIDNTSQLHLQQKIALNAQVFESALEGILILDDEFRVVDTNPAYHGMTGFSPLEVLGEIAAFVNPRLHSRPYLESVFQALEQHHAWQGEVWDRRKDGSEFIQWVSVTRITDPASEVQNYTVLISDITQQKTAEQQLYRMAHYDILTGLPNRRLFYDRLDQAMMSVDRDGERIAILLIDLDGFKQVNDQFGHSVGDEMLKMVSDRLLSSVRKSDTVGRMGGDEFLVLLRHLKEDTDATQIANKILATIAEPVSLGEHEFYLTASIGMSLYRKRQSIERLLRDIDQAMYSVKMDGKNSYRIVSDYSPTLTINVLTQQAKLRKALENGEIQPYYQGIVDPEERRLVGMEVLARWLSPTQGVIPPDDFIGIAEDTGLIKPLGEHILRSALRQGMEWRAMGIDIGVLSVNVSAAQLRDEHFVPMVESILDETGYPASLLDLELNESLWIDGNRTIIDRLNALRGLGVTIAIDDFGTKYASLSYLKNLPVDRIKIDRSFICDLPDGQINPAIVASILMMAQSIDLEVTAEGIETVEQSKYLSSHGCRTMQGFLYCRPLPAADIPDLVRAPASIFSKRVIRHDDN